MPSWGQVECYDTLFVPERLLASARERVPLESPRASSQAREDVHQSCLAPPTIAESLWLLQRTAGAEDSALWTMVVSS
jgi:hypothetical protein